MGQQGFRVRYTLATKLVNELVEAADERQLAKTIARYGRVDLLCIDELGYMELDRRGAELLFQVLTEREDEVLKLIAEGSSSKEIARTLTISVETVERHRANILAKLGMRDRTQLTRYAIRAGLIEP